MDSHSKGDINTIHKNLDIVINSDFHNKFRSNFVDGNVPSDEKIGVERPCSLAIVLVIKFTKAGSGTKAS